MQSLLFIQINLFYFFTAIFLIDLMQSFLFYPVQSFCKLNPVVFYLFSVMCFIYLMQLVFINAMQSSFIWLLWLNSEAQVEHLTI